MLRNIPQGDLLCRLLETCSLRQEVIAQNVANVNTPGYQRRVVRFEEELARQLRSAPLTGRASPLAVSPVVVLDTHNWPRADGNTVDLAQEMGLLTRNSLLYQTYLQILALRLGELRSAITGR
ncbi:MAG: flagellar basal body rod protein FlgB [Gemmatales bacterium]|nr:flagellar basal body rod protein FlgB [Gemmatales bacterium]MCS7160307.1 flagellar basal body rod protein FlgB [Gemmatales bacterium]MDW8175507.1 flagellar basal body rod protein FlgB [Gemmatales bacterium]MDW8222300.1 flagellar basal body rod protein FlgB [Gemmatales bacterium]